MTSRWAHGSLAVLITFALASLVSCGPPDRQSGDALIGHWLGNVSYRDATAKLEFDIERQGDSLIARVTSDELLMRDLPIGHVSFDKPRVHFVLPDEEAPITFDGWLRRNLVVGTFTASVFPNPERKATLPQLSLRHTHPSMFPYRVDTLRFTGAGVSLAARLYTPSTQGPYPAVVLLQGSTQNLGASLNAYADRFARAGFVALVYDKRGAGASSGDPLHYTLRDLEADAEGAFRFLRSRASIDTAHVGLWGFSQGAFLAPRVAQASRAAFIVAVSAPVTTLEDNAAWQDSVRRRAPPSGRRPRWFTEARAEDPRPVWRETKLPVLAIYGERDDLVPGPRSAASLAALLTAAGHADHRIMVVPRANHALELRPTAEEPFDWPREAPGVVDSMITWMRARSFAR